MTYNVIVVSAVQHSDIHIHYEIITTISLITIRHHLKFLLSVPTFCWLIHLFIQPFIQQILTEHLLCARLCVHMKLLFNKYLLLDIVLASCAPSTSRKDEWVPEEPHTAHVREATSQERSFWGIWDSSLHNPPETKPSYSPVKPLSHDPFSVGRASASGRSFISLWTDCWKSLLMGLLGSQL